MPRPILCSMLVAAALTLPSGFAFAYPCGKHCTCPSPTVKHCYGVGTMQKVCYCEQPSPDWGINPGGKAEPHKKNVPTVKPGGGPPSAYWQTSRHLRTHTSPTFKYQMQRLRPQGGRNVR